MLHFHLINNYWIYDEYRCKGGKPRNIPIFRGFLLEKQMSLRKKQSEFTLLSAKLIIKAYELGYEITYGFTQRCKVCPVGKISSLHKSRLAIDINLFKDGKFLTKTSDHKILGEWWEKQHDLARWGGRFNDGNHYSFEHGGMK